MKSLLNCIMALKTLHNHYRFQSEVDLPTNEKLQILYDLQLKLCMKNISLILLLNFPPGLPHIS